MRTLLDEIVIKRPACCYDYPMGADDSDEGRLCCGHIREYGYKGDNIEYIDSPDDVIKYGGECLFVKEDEQP